MTEHYILQFPFTSAAGDVINTLQLRRLKVKDMRNARRISEKPEEWDEPLMAAMTGLVPEDLAEMDLLDYQALQKRFQSMLSVATESSLAMAGNGATGEMVSLSAQ
ncbi:MULTISPECIES: phage tail assembly protein [Escherichia]|uniref:phage tail assembly protein n=1 Tax=Escherichia TaxID=561 RepID=UPI0007E322D3|nr:MULTISPECIES: phage tail assembly protein [Escherichia]MEB7937396.1 phage tail assembly protein [Escherichia whittamii]MEC9498124.1 phage tail assembly protein [Escherichia whittamii]MEC9558609.1 phage tail assembly protein [Escherichia whittamii]QLX42782.1 phage tail assembly protein [Escherichia coli]